jgi:hypothetical protein
VKGERFLSLPLAVKPSIDGGILPDFLHFPSVLVRHHQHVLEHSLEKEKNTCEEKYRYAALSIIRIRIHDDLP